MFIYTNSNHDIEKLKGCEFPLVMVLDNGMHVFSVKCQKDVFPTFSFDELENSQITNELLF